MNGRRLSVRDYKGARRGAAQSWLRPYMLGVVTGLAMAAAAFWVMSRHHFAPAAVAAAAAATAPVNTTAPAAALAAPSRAAASTTGDVRGNSSDSGSGAMTQLPTGLPKYDFYQMLPHSQVLVAGRESEARTGGSSEVERPGVYFLQIGSYRDAAMADRVRTQAQKLGVAASIQRIVVDTSTWHRVRVGPIRDLTVLNRLRHQLQAGNLEAMVVRIN